MKNFTSGAAIKSAKKIIEERQPSKKYPINVFSLLSKDEILIKPSFTFVDENENRCDIRYDEQFNSIFVEEQPMINVKVKRIDMTKTFHVRSQLLLNFLLLHPKFNKDWKLHDPAAIEQRALDKLDEIDLVWDKLRGFKDEQLIAVRLLVPEAGTTSVSDLSVTSRAMILMPLRRIANQDPSRIREALENPVLGTIGLYYMGIELDIIKYNKRRQCISWVSSGEEICKVPIDENPGTYLAKMMLTEEFAQVRELLDKKLHD